MKVYVNDMFVKSFEKDDYIKDLKEIFGTLRDYQMKLNPTKCIFKVTIGKFLIFLVTKHGIETNPEKNLNHS